MSANNGPRVSIGLPVYNGEKFLEEAVESILAQTFEDFELIISDNASTDRTEAICRAYAARDKRIRYFRSRENVGAARNFNHVFALLSGEYFKWAAHDDVCQPNFLHRCVQVLDQDPSVVLCYTRTITIDAQGQFRRKWGARPELGSFIPHRRFREILAPQETFPVWGLMRANILRKTLLIGSWPASDLSLLAELSLYGRFYEIPEALFLHREHPQRSIHVYDWRIPQCAVVWWDPLKAGKVIFPEWRLLAVYLSAINRVTLSWHERVRCYIEVARWLKRHRQELLRDLMIAGECIPGIGPVVGRTYKKCLEAIWVNRLHHAAKEIDLVIPVEDMFILVDEGTFGTEVFAGRRTLPFLEREGQYWGPPLDDDTAIHELERLCRSGANYMVFGWPTFWWLDHYAQLYHYLRSKFRCVLKNDRLVVFDLRS